jgi:hypothetical protein
MVNCSGYHIAVQKQNGTPIFTEQLQEYLTCMASAYKQTHDENLINDSRF